MMTVILACTSAATGDLETIQRLQIQGINLNDGDYDKRTPLHLAAASGHYDIVKYLVDYGVEINCKDRWGATPLNDSQDPKITEYLQKNGAKKGFEQPQYLKLPQSIVSD